MTNRAGLQIQSRFFVGMRIQKTRHMICRLQLRSLGMAELATVRQIDLVVTHQAIRHLRHIGPAHRVRFLEAPMASQTRVRGIQKRPDLRPVQAQISSLIHSRGNHRRNVRELQMFSVTEFLEGRRIRRGKNPQSGSQEPECGYPLYLIRQIFFPPSSDTRMLPSGNCITATGRPHTSRDSGEIIQPVRNSRTGPLGLPFLNGINATS
jgi:hypothetical protein